MRQSINFAGMACGAVMVIASLFQSRTTYSAAAVIALILLLISMRTD